MPAKREPRKLTDPRELRAVAHPVRWALLEALLVEGPLTATEAAERVGESPANCSWHLRQLAKYGFVEEVATTGGRRRPWRLVNDSMTTEGGPESGIEFEAAANAMQSVIVDRFLSAYGAFRQRRRAESRAWWDAAKSTSSLQWLTADELTAIRDEVLAIWTRHLDRDDPAKRPPGARLVRMLSLCFPDDPPGPA